jgi:hypothetical protein
VPRYLKVAAAQLGAIPEGTTREQMVERMLALMDQAIAEHASCPYWCRCRCSSCQSVSHLLCRCTTRPWGT